MAKRRCSILQSKLAIRKKIRELRAGVSSDDRVIAAQSAAKILAEHPLFKNARHIACYHSYGDEFQTATLIEAVWAANKICYLPVLGDAKSLQFVRYRRHDELQLNQYSIPEPVETQYRIPAEKLDLVITPLVAFDRQGNRIGTGGGFYDHTFAFLFNKPAQAPFMLGVGYSFQECQGILADAWDISLNGVLTEKELITL